MPYSGEGTPAEITQRQQAARTHGTRAFWKRGESALEPAQRSRLVEIREMTGDQDGVLELMRERTSSAVMLAELAEAWIRDQAERGIPFDQMTMLNRISTFQETARRHLLQLSEMLPRGPERRTLTELLRGNHGD